MDKILHKPKLLLSSKGLGLPNTLKTIKKLTEDTLVLEELWQEMEKPWSQGNTIIAKPGYKWVGTWVTDKNFISTDMFDEKGALVGTYYDICDKVKNVENEFSFEDWYLDVWKPSNKPMELLDADELEEALKLGFLTKEQYDVAKTTAEYLLDSSR